MSKKSFVQLLRKIIREEVTKAVRSEMRTALNENKTDHSKVIDHGISLHDMVEEPVPFKKQKRREYSKNSMLNDILNETGPLRENSVGNTMNFNAQMAQSFNRSSTVAPPTDIDGRPVNTGNEKVATVVNAMTKDYSALMKAIDKKKGK